MTCKQARHRNGATQMNQNRKNHVSRSKVKVLLTVFFDIRGVVHSEFLPVGQTVNKQYYLSVMKRLRESIRRKRPEL